MQTHLWIMSGFVALLTACASASDTSQPEEKAPVGAAKFADDPRLGDRIERVCFQRPIRRFRETTEDTVVIVRGPKTQYLFEIQPICLGLRRAKTVALLADGPICVRRGDSIFVSEFIGTLSDNDFTTGRCQIRSIYEWDPNAAEEANASETEAPD